MRIWAGGTVHKKTYPESSQCQETGKHRDSCREALVVQIPLQPLPLSQQDGGQVVSSSEQREAADSLEIKEKV